MTAADWAILVPALAGFLAGAGAYLRSLSTRSQLRQHLSGHYYPDEQRKLGVPMPLRDNLAAVLEKIQEAIASIDAADAAPAEPAVEGDNPDAAAVVGDVPAEDAPAGDASAADAHDGGPASV